MLTTSNLSLNYLKLIFEVFLTFRSFEIPDINPEVGIYINILLLDLLVVILSICLDTTPVKKNDSWDQDDDTLGGMHLRRAFSFQDKRYNLQNILQVCFLYHVYILQHADFCNIVLSFLNMNGFYIYLDIINFIDIRTISYGL